MHGPLLHHFLGELWSHSQTTHHTLFSPDLGNFCPDIFTMATATSAKRVLAESTNALNNGNLSPSASTAKKRKLDRVASDRNIPNGDRLSKLLSSQPKTQFEEHLESLSQNMSGLRDNNHEKDQQWERPSLDDFYPESDSLCFQQIDVEEGTIAGGKQTIRLFGVTEVYNTQA